MNQTNLLVTKFSGEKAPFDESKLRHSLQRSKADETVISQIIAEVRTGLYDGITTREIYTTAFALLKDSSLHTAARYKLKDAMYELGPSGFPFEKFVAEVLKAEGFNTQLNVTLQGHCVTHEVDVIATKGAQHFLVECKFHNDKARVCDVKIPLYIHSRFRDVMNHVNRNGEPQNSINACRIVTNTRFSSDAIQYASCCGLVLTGWDYPKNNSLKMLIDRSGLHPVTSLGSLSQEEKQALLAKEIVLSKELCQRPELLRSIGISQKRHQTIMEEAHELCLP